MDGSVLDPNAAGIDIVSLGVERDGFRNGRLVINASMEGTVDGEDVGWAGIYVAQVPEPGTWALLGLGGLFMFLFRRRALVTA